MKAIVYHRYGSPDVLELDEIDKPLPADNEVLIKVRAAAVNPYDWHFIRGTPYLVRLFAGLRRPKEIRLGVDVAGEVEAVGSSVTHFKPGDEVFGAGRGVFAEYACALESTLIQKPENISLEQAGSVAIAAFTALQGLRDKGRIRAGQRVLVNGAAGGVGTFAVQIAKAFGADVTGVCSTRNLELVRSIGAAKVIDYTREDFSKGKQCYDLIFDAVGNHSLFACRRVLNPGGRLVLAGGSAGKWMIGAIARTLLAPLLSIFGSRKIVGFIAKFNQDDLAKLRDLLQAGTVTPVIGRRYALSQVPDAIRYLETGRARGKVAITFD